MNTFMNGLKNATNYTYTTNGALTRKTSGSDVLDMFAQGGAYRKRSDEDCILLFKNAYADNPKYALKCLFYLRDCNSNSGQGERRFFRVCYRWLANNYPEVAKRNMEYIPAYGRYDDLYCLVNTPIETEMWKFIEKEISKGLIILKLI